MKMGRLEGGRVGRWYYGKVGKWEGGSLSITMARRRILCSVVDEFPIEIPTALFE